MLSAPRVKPRAAPISWAERLEGIDVALIGAAGVLAAIGVVMVYSATRVSLAALGRDPRYYLKRQAVWAGLGLVAMAATATLDYRRLRDWAAMIYAAPVVALLVVMSPIGSAAKGSQRWLALGPFQLQPSAFVSLGAIVAVAALCWKASLPLGTSRVWVVLALVGAPGLLVAAQPDLGTAIVLGTVALAMLVVAGARARHLAGLAVMAALGVVVVVNSGVLKQYQVDRLTAFVDPSHNQLSAAYNLAQSKTAIGSGGLTGKGLFKGTQTNLSYVPEQRTDFIFTAVGEQLGFAGSALVLVLYAALAWRLWRAALSARDGFGRLLCVGVLAMVVVQVFQNAGMTMGIMPITGIPLPLLSYGGSSTIAFFAAIGVAQSVERLRFR